jgi:hypothetical protein
MVTVTGAIVQITRNQRQPPPMMMASASQPKSHAMQTATISQPVFQRAPHSIKSHPRRGSPAIGTSE